MGNEPAEYPETCLYDPETEEHVVVTNKDHWVASFDNLEDAKLFVTAWFVARGIETEVQYGSEKTH